MTSSVHYVNQGRKDYGQYQPSNQHNQQDRFLPQNQYQKQLSQSHLER